MSSSEQSATKKPKLEVCPIGDLADEDLANIFKRLPPFERLLISQVCKRWHGISRIQWLDVNTLDLSSVPSENALGIMKLCPNKQTVFAKNKTFSFKELSILSQTSLVSLKLYDCSTIVRLQTDEHIDLFAAAFSEHFAWASWDELVLHDLRLVVDLENDAVKGLLPASLKRLQLSGIVVDSRRLFNYCLSEEPRFLHRLGRLQELSCLILCAKDDTSCLIGRVMESGELFLQELRGLKNLRELCMGSCAMFSTFDMLGSDLPKLEVLFLNNFCFDLEDGDLSALLTKHSTLRILCITGTFRDERTVPIRRLYPTGFGSDPLPLLHVFLGKEASEKIVFTKSSPNALRIHPITDPLPEFLEKEEIAPIFHGVWIAAQIKDGAKHGAQLWNSNGDAATSFRHRTMFEMDT